MPLIGKEREFSMIYPSLDEARERLRAAPECKILPVRVALYADDCTPVQVLRRLKNASRHCFLLESADSSQKWGRYTFLGYEPSLELTCSKGTITLREGEKIQQEKGHPSVVIRRILAAHRSLRLPGMPPFTGGLVGYVGYDYIQYQEPSLHLDAKDDEGFQDVDLMLFDRAVVFDHFSNQLILIVNLPCDRLEEAYFQAEQTLAEMRELVLRGDDCKEQPGHLTSPLRRLFEPVEYCAMVEKAKVHIVDGDIFQVVLSNRLDADFEGSLLDTYRVLRATNPSPYLFYFSSDDLEVAGASPETLVRLEDGMVHTFPLAGTRPRGQTEEEDRRLEQELLADEKERAEHNMLVDLGRNDIGRISGFGSVQVKEYMRILRFSHVMHIGSTVQGRIRPELDALDALGAILPAGTLSGAPKIKAMELINQLENCRRGLYGGAIGYFGFSGNLDSCIAIRVAYKKNGKVYVRAGAGIVADSVPEREYQECINKAMAVVRALEAAEGGLFQ